MFALRTGAPDPRWAGGAGAGATAVPRQSKPAEAVAEQARGDYAVRRPRIRRPPSAHTKPSRMADLAAPDRAYRDRPHATEADSPYLLWRHSAGTKRIALSKSMQSHRNGAAPGVTRQVNILP